VRRAAAITTAEYHRVFARLPSRASIQSLAVSGSGEGYVVSHGVPYVHGMSRWGMASEETSQYSSPPLGPTFEEPDESRSEMRAHDARQRALIARVMRSPAGQRLVTARDLGVEPHSLAERAVLMAMGRELESNLVGLTEREARDRVAREPGLKLTIHRKQPGPSLWGKGWGVIDVLADAGRITEIL
jgi:hypothetical protein